MNVSRELIADDSNAIAIIPPKTTIQSVPPTPSLHPIADHLIRLRHALKPMIEASYMSIDDAENEAQIRNFMMDRGLSNENTYVYMDTQTGFPLIVHRGSVTAQDWLLEDLLLMTGVVALVSSPRLLTAKAITNEVQLKYGRDADSFGHSLGGYLAEESGANGYIMTYNKGSGFSDVAKTVKNNKQMDYRSAKDIVSLLSETQYNNRIRYVGQDAGFIDAHSVSNLPDVAEERRRT
jgi:hypothetical protein